MTREELEKEAEEYAIKQWEGNIPWGVIQKAYYDSAEPREKQIAELEKENAKLQGLVNQYKASKCGSISLVNQNMIMFDQLTKAKEILKAVVDFYPTMTATILLEAEQFLKGE